MPADTPSDSTRASLSPTTAGATPVRDPNGLAVAVVVGAHGVRGWVRVHLYDPSSSALRRNRVVTLRGPNVEPITAQICAVEPVPGKPLCRVQLTDVVDRDRAEALRGRELWLARKDLPALGAGEFYLADVIGLPVERLRPDGQIQALGVVAGLTTNGAQDLLEVEYQLDSGRRDSWLLPALPQFIAEVEGRVRVELPLGMLPDALAAGESEDDEEPRP